jgi:hypothetical protein
LVRISAFFGPVDSMAVGVVSRDLVTLLKEAVIGFPFVSDIMDSLISSNEPGPRVSRGGALLIFRHNLDRLIRWKDLIPKLVIHDSMLDGAFHGKGVGFF